MMELGTRGLERPLYKGSRSPTRPTREEVIINQIFMSMLYIVHTIQSGTKREERHQLNALQEI
jgi:hypothetical protein